MASFGRSTRIGLHDDFEQLQTSYQEFHDDESDDGSSTPPQFQQTYQTKIGGAGDGNIPQASGYGRPTLFSPKTSRPIGEIYGHNKKNYNGINNEDSPGGGNVIIHHVPEESKSRWSHIEDLDSFFKKVYEYHQRHGFKVMMLQQCFDLIQVGFVVVLITYLFECVDYKILFNIEAPPGKKHGEKVLLKDVIIPLGECAATFSFKTWVFLTVAVSLWLWKLLAVGYQVFQYWDIKSFYNQALKIDDDQLDSVTWNEVQKRLVEAQSDYLMCIHKTQLTELDIYHRILRVKNYLVAMVNKELLPVRFSIPCVNGTQFVFLSQGLKWNLEFLFFKGPWAPFDKWHLKEDYKKSNKRKELIDHLQGKIALVAMLNFLLMPLILFWQILYSFFNYAELVKREPGCLGVRKWSQYGRLYLRHFNEHDHELKARLVRAYKPANQYMDFFVSPLAAVTARFVTFIAGSILGVLILLSVWDEDVLNVEHVLTIITVMGAIVAGARILIPDPNMVLCPEKTLAAVMAHIHYFPDCWKGEAHTSKVMSELGELFPYTAVYLLQELISPILTPFILFFSLRSRSGAIVDFFRNFTVDVVGVGDVCSFAQMDVRRHGNPEWQQKGFAHPAGNQNPPAEPTAYSKAEDGKTEMSLLHFALTNPDWKPPQEEQTQFIQQLRGQVSKEAENLITPQQGVNALPALAEEKSEQNIEENVLYASLNSLDAAGGVYSELANSIMADAGLMRSPSHFINSRRSETPYKESSICEERGDQEDTDKHTQQGSLLQSVHQGLATGRSSILAMSQKWPLNGSIMTATGNTSQWLAPPPNLRQDLRRLGLEYTAADMSLSALYMHELHHRAAAATSSETSHTSSRRGYPTPGGNVATPASAMNMTNAMRNSLNSDYNQSSSLSGSHRIHKKTSLRELEEESLPLVDATNPFNSSSLEINAESSSGTSYASNNSSTSGSKNKADLIQV